VTAEPCPFCLIVEGMDPSARVLYRDSKVVAFSHSSRRPRDDTLVIPHRTRPTHLDELEPHEVRELAAAVHGSQSR
jgi:diadenosine tetraphosphate (Ap4A) HIT family hydrolase